MANAPLVPFCRRCQSRYSMAPKGCGHEIGDQCHFCVPEPKASGCGIIKGHDEDVSATHPMWKLLENPDHPLWSVAADFPLLDPKNPLWQLPPNHNSWRSLTDRMAQAAAEAQVAAELKRQVAELQGYVDEATTQGYLSKDDDLDIVNADILDLEGDQRPDTGASSVDSAKPGPPRTLKEQVSALRAAVRRQRAAHKAETEKLDHQLKDARKTSDKLMAASYGILDALDMGYQVQALPEDQRPSTTLTMGGPYVHLPMIGKPGTAGPGAGGPPGTAWGSAPGTAGTAPPGTAGPPRTARTAYSLPRTAAGLAAAFPPGTAIPRTALPPGTALPRTAAGLAGMATALPRTAGARTAGVPKTALPFTAMPRTAFAMAHTAALENPGYTAPGVAAPKFDEAAVMQNNLEDMLNEVTQMLERMEPPPPPPSPPRTPDGGRVHDEHAGLLPPISPKERPQWIPPGIAGMYPYWFMLGPRMAKRREAMGDAAMFGDDDDTYWV